MEQKIMEMNEVAAIFSDQNDPLSEFRNEFNIPIKNNKEVIYFTGNSLGLQPKKTHDYIQQELEDWKHLGVEGHVHAQRPWMPYHEFLTPYMAEIAGAKNEEVVMMNQLTVNLHLLLVSFYRPTKERYKIITEGKSFPSDRYALVSQIKFHGFNPEEALIEVFPDEGEFSIRPDKILQTIEKHKNELALVMMGGVNYYTGQVFDMKSITEAAHKAGAYCGFDLAHAAGNIELKLHEWEVDFACWCSYKYLNSGPGSVAGAFVHERHHRNFDLPLFAGWWGSNKATRFLMQPEFDPIPTAERWQLSNAPVLSMAACLASLEIFHRAKMTHLIEKSKKLTRLLEYVIHQVINQKNKNWKIITPADARGCQISLFAGDDGKKLFEFLDQNGIITDWREPGVIRMAPVPLYNTFNDIYQFGNLLMNFKN